MLNDGVTHQEAVELLEDDPDLETIKYKKNNGFYVARRPLHVADARLIVAFKYKKSWRYTSGVQWIQTDLQDKTGERITAHYSKNGCYYMKLNEDLSGRIENAQPIIDGVGTKTLQWSVFLDISKEP
jgi:hypothetical protein